MLVFACGDGSSDAPDDAERPDRARINDAQDDAQRTLSGPANGRERTSIDDAGAP
jgi:hypothetical protein